MNWKQFWQDFRAGMARDRSAELFAQVHRRVALNEKALFELTEKHNKLREEHDRLEQRYRALRDREY